MVAVALAVITAACGGQDADPQPTPPPEEHTPAGTEPSELVAEAAVTDTLAGLPELTEFLRRSLRDEPLVCQDPEPEADARVAVERRAFTTGTPEEEFVEIQQSTTAYELAEAAETFVAESQRLLADCAEAASEGQVTRDYAVIDMPEGFDGEAVSAVMEIVGPGDEFSHRRGCVQHGLLVQCTQVWSVEEDLADQYFADALTEGAASLQSVDLG